MNILFIHPNQPAQFEFAAKELAKSPDNQVIMLSRTNLNVQLPGVRIIGFNDGPQKVKNSIPILEKFNSAAIRAIEVARLCLNLSHEGFKPDLIVAHSGWGDGIYVKTVFPETPLINYMEFYNQPKGADLDFFSKSKQAPNALAKATTINAIHSLNFFNADFCITPTYWQRSVHPREMHQKIEVLHEGVDTNICKPDEHAFVTLSNGTQLDRQNHEIITHVERTFDRYRGFPTFLKAAGIIQNRRPKAHVLIVGKDGEGYSPGNFKKMINNSNLDPERTHFLGHLQYNKYLKVLQVSSAHVYLSAPFVLSWSFLEAMATGCPMVCSNTPPVAEIGTDKENCLMFNFFNAEELADAVEVLLEDKAYAQNLGHAARNKIVAQYDRSKLLPMFVKLITDMAENRGTNTARQNINDWNCQWGREEELWQKSVPLFEHK